MSDDAATYGGDEPHPLGYDETTYEARLRDVQREGRTIAEIVGVPPLEAKGPPAEAPGELNLFDTPTLGGLTLPPEALGPPRATPEKPESVAATDERLESAECLEALAPAGECPQCGANEYTLGLCLACGFDAAAVKAMDRRLTEDIAALAGDIARPPEIAPETAPAALEPHDEALSVLAALDAEPAVPVPVDDDGATGSLFGADLFGERVQPAGRGIMQQRFILPPFSVLDARQGVWQDRKRAWLSYGIRSELGRGEGLTYESEQVQDRDFYRHKEGTRSLPAAHDPSLQGGLTFGTGVRPYSVSGHSDEEARKAAAADEERRKYEEATGNPAARGEGRYGDGRFTFNMDQFPNYAKGQKPRRKADARSFGTDLMRGEGGYEYGGRPKRDQRAIPGGGTGANSAYLFRTEEGYEASEEAQLAGAGTSIFDPVLCELSYRWFCPPGGRILDPFAGGSVRGIVAALLGYSYTGVDLSARQLAANREQWETLPKLPRALPEPVVPADYTPPLTPLEHRGPYRLKRDDLYSIAGVRGGKVRTCWGLAKGARGLVTAGSRSSPQVNIVAHIAARLGIPCRVHTPEGELSPEVKAAQAAGAEVVQHPAGYNSVIVARAREDAAARGWTEIPFGMECQAAVDAAASQVANLPTDARLVVPVGSGMTLAGILAGLERCGKALPAVVGVVCGADPTKRLDRWAPAFWRQMVDLVPAGVPYAEHVTASLGGVRLDPVYEAKVLPHLQPGDTVWLVGVRQTLADTLPPAPLWLEGDSLALPALAGGHGPFDYVFTCPPYADLEVYSNDPRDLSTMAYPDFRAVYGEIIRHAVSLLAPDRFASVVVGEVRGKDGPYYGFIPDTVRAFEQAGAKYYDEGILLTAVGSLPVRTGKQFQSGRKLGKTHQQVLTFCKGDWRKAAAVCGPIDLGEQV